MDDTDDLELDLPVPPPWPAREPVPLHWDVRTEAGRRQERRHRLAVLNDACPECADPPGSPSFRDFLRDLARPRPLAPDEIPPTGGLVTPEGELASFVHGTPEVVERAALTRWADANLTRTGDVFAHVGNVDGSPWPRALLWFGDDDRLHLEASSLDRYLHLEITLQRLWPPVFRGSRILAPLDVRLDAPFRPDWPAPPAEVSVFTRLQPVATTSDIRGQAPCT